jgi:hypothetical protein
VWLGETIIDSTEIDEEQALQMFDRENEHLQTWSRDQKLKYMHDWKSKEW